ncbi:MAG: hypothetical protein JST67_00315 [Bacteroidetes bacterium]|nr:hypothetical protein [Bacteroidota bacterium]
MTRIIFLLLLLLSLSTQAQIEWGPLQYNQQSESKHIGVVAEDEKNIYVLKLDYGFKAVRIWVLECVDKVTKGVLFSKALPTPHASSNEYDGFDEIIMVDTSLYMFKSVINSTNKTISCYALKINKQTGSHLETKEIYRTEVEEANSNLRYSITPNGKNLLITSAPFNSEKNKMKIVDGELNEVREVDFSTSNNKLKMKTFQVIIDDNNNVCVYAYHQDELYEENGYLILNKTNDRQPLFFKLRGHDRINSKTLSYIYDSKFISINNKFYLFSLFYYADPLQIDKYKSNGGDAYISMRTRGLSSITLNPENEGIINYKTNHFTKEQNIEVQGIKPNWTDSANVYLADKAFADKEGNIFLVAEARYSGLSYFYSYQTSSYGYYGAGSNTSYYAPGQSANLYKSDYLSVFKFDTSGKINWCRLIPKHQEHVVGQYLSYSFVEKNKSLYFIYNDNPRNRDDNTQTYYGPRTMESHKNAIGKITKISFNGDMQTKVFYYPTKSNQKIILKPLVSAHANQNNILIFGMRKNKFKWAEINPETFFDK